MPSPWKTVFAPQPRMKRLESFREPLESETHFLAGKNKLWKDLIRLARIVVEFLRGMRKLRNVGPAVSVFGSAQFHEGHPYYKQAQEMGAHLAAAGYTVMTGGGPGIMEAANRGAKNAGGPSIGCNIILPREQGPNPYLDRFVTFHYFFVRKIMLVKYCYAFVIMPGGVGTLDEMFEAMTLIKTGKLYDFPIILVGKKYWEGLYSWVFDVLVKEGAVSREEMSFVHLTDDPNEVLSIINQSVRGLSVRLTPVKAPSP